MRSILSNFFRDCHFIKTNFRLVDIKIYRSKQNMMKPRKTFHIFLKPFNEYSVVIRL